MTTFQTNSYEEACLWGRITYDLYERGKLGWLIGQHTWVSYSRLDARAKGERPLVVTTGAAPKGYELLAQGSRAADRRVRLYCRDRRLADTIAELRPPSGPDRAPWIMQPIAVRPPARPPTASTE